MYLYYTSESYLEPLYHWEPKWIHVGMPSANLTRPKALIPRAFGTRLGLRACCLVRKQYKTESLTKTTQILELSLKVPGEIYKGKFSCKKGNISHKRSLNLWYIKLIQGDKVECCVSFEVSWPSVIAANYRPTLVHDHACGGTPVREVLER